MRETRVEQKHHRGIRRCHLFTVEYLDTGLRQKDVLVLCHAYSIVDGSECLKFRENQWVWNIMSLEPEATGYLRTTVRRYRVDQSNISHLAVLVISSQHRG